MKKSNLLRFNRREIKTKSKRQKGKVIAFPVKKQAASTNGVEVQAFVKCNNAILTLTHESLNEKEYESFCDLILMFNSHLKRQRGYLREVTTRSQDT